MDEFIETCEEKLAENSIKYLYNISDENSLPTILKSIYSTKCRIFENINKRQINSIKTNIKSRCSRCCIKFSDGPTSYRVKPEVKKNKFTKKLIKKSETGKTVTKYQKKCLRKLRQGNIYKRNQLSITCGICDKNRNIFLDKSKKDKVEEEKTSFNTVRSKVKKKRKKKDKLCGLKESAVVSSLSVNNNKNKTKLPLEQNKNNTKLPLLQNNNITNKKTSGKIGATQSTINLIDLTKDSKKNKKNKKKNKQRGKQEQPVQEPSNSKINITLNNNIAKRKESKKKQKNMEKIKSMINNSSKSKKISNKLNQFLKSF